MQLKKIAALCAVAFAGFSGQAMAALTSAQITVLNDANGQVIPVLNPTGEKRIMFISGASAVQKGFNDIITATFSGTPTYFSVQGGGDSAALDKADFVAVAGTLAAGNGPWSGKNAIIIYRVKGGSVMGVNPVAKNDAIESIKVNATDCGSSGTGVKATPYSCVVTPEAEYMVPDAGVSDVAPKLFKQEFNTEGETAAAELTSTELATLTSTAIYGLAFGVPVTNTVGSAVKFNRANVSAIMTGNVGTWDQVDSTESGDIVICRRVPGSGTQAVMNLWAGNYPCGTSNAPADREASGLYVKSEDPLVASTMSIPANTGGLVVIENSTSAQVRSCLEKAVDGGSYPTSDRSGNPVTVTFESAGNKAIGVLSMDSLDKSTSGSKWQFRALDGAGKLVQDTAGAVPTTIPAVLTGGKVPTLAAYENGDWDLQGWISFNVPSRTTGNKKAVLDNFLKNAKNPAVLQASSALKFVTAAIPGGTYTGPFVLDAAYSGGNQCAPYNRNYND